MIPKQKCAKYRSAAHHHFKPMGDCRDCVYFSAKNCGRHGAEASFQEFSNLIY